MKLKQSLLLTFFSVLFLINASCKTTDNTKQEANVTVKQKIEKLKQEQQECLNSLKIAFGVGGIALGASLISRYFLSNQAKNAGSFIKNAGNLVRKAFGFKILSVKALRQGSSTGYHEFNDKCIEYYVQAKALLDYTPTTLDNALSVFSAASGLVSFFSFFHGILSGAAYCAASENIKELESEINNA